MQAEEFVSCTNCNPSLAEQDQFSLHRHFDLYDLREFPAFLQVQVSTRDACGHEGLCPSSQGLLPALLSSH